MQCRIFPLAWRPQVSWGVRSQQPFVPIVSRAIAAVLGVAMVGIACDARRPAATGIHVECRPGGRCTSAARPTLDAVSRLFALPDLRSHANAPAVRREVRLWLANADPRLGGGLRRYVVDSGGRVMLEHRSWWFAADAGGGGQTPYGAACDRVLQVGSLRGCLERRRPHDAAAQLRTLEALGLDSLPGNGAAPDTSGCTDMCLAPAHIVVELWAPGRYRSYGAPVPAGPASAPIESTDVRYHRLFQVNE